MAYIGQAPTPLPLTASDIPDLPATKITSGTFPALDGSNLTGVSAGKVGQVISAVTTTATNIASTSYADTTATASITPSATTSKVLVLVSINCNIDRDNSDGWVGIKLLRDSTNIWEANEYIAWDEAGGVGAIKASDQASLVYLDSPSSTSALTYKVQGKSSHTSNNGQARFQISNNTSSVTLMEILQ